MGKTFSEHSSLINAVERERKRGILSRTLNTEMRTGGIAFQEGGRGEGGRAQNLYSVARNIPFSS
jgi:hypothetical protein